MLMVNNDDDKSSDINDGGDNVLVVSMMRMM